MIIIEHKYLLGNQKIFVLDWNTWNYKTLCKHMIIIK